MYWKSVNSFTSMQRGRKSYSQWKQEIIENEVTHGGEVNDKIKTYEVICNREKMKLQSSKFGMLSGYVSLVVAFITAVLNGIYYVYNASNNVAVSLFAAEPSREDEVMYIIGKNNGYQIELISGIGIVMILLILATPLMFLGYHIYKNYRINRMLFFEEKLKVLKEVANGTR